MLCLLVLLSTFFISIPLFLCQALNSDTFLCFLIPPSNLFISFPSTRGYPTCLLGTYTSADGRQFETILYFYTHITNNHCDFTSHSENHTKLTELGSTAGQWGKTYRTRAFSLFSYEEAPSVSCKKPWFCEEVVALSSNLWQKAPRIQGYVIKKHRN